METTIHYLGGRSTNTLCGLTPNAVHAQVGLVSIFSRDVDCRVCNAKIKEMAEMGFTPTR